MRVSTPAGWWRSMPFPAPHAYLFAARAEGPTQNTVYYSTNIGTTWKELGFGPPLGRVDLIRAQMEPVNRVLVVAERGWWSVTPGGRWTPVDAAPGTLGDMEIAHEVGGQDSRRNLHRAVHGATPEPRSHRPGVPSVRWSRAGDLDATVGGWTSHVAYRSKAAATWQWDRAGRLSGDMAPMDGDATGFEPSRRRACPTTSSMWRSTRPAPVAAMRSAATVCSEPSIMGPAGWSSSYPGRPPTSAPSRSIRPTPTRCWRSTSGGHCIAATMVVVIG